jgi:hypothetical protein
MIPKFEKLGLDGTQSSDDFNLYEFENDMLKTYISSQKEEFE